MPEKDLKGFTTTEKDRKRGVDRFPPINFRNRKEDIAPDQQDDAKEEEPIQQMNYEDGLKLREQQQKET